MLGPGIITPFQVTNTGKEQSVTAAGNGGDSFIPSLKVGVCAQSASGLSCILVVSLNTHRNIAGPRSVDVFSSVWDRDPDAGVSHPTIVSCRRCSCFRH